MCKSSVSHVTLTDTHTHLYLEEFGGSDGAAAAVDRAVAAGVSLMVMPNVSLATVAPMKVLNAMRPEVTRMAMGLHPTEVSEGWSESLAEITRELESGRDLYVAVGEIGMDLYWDRTYREHQMQVFDRQCALACQLGLPVIIHCREALEETIEVISGHSGLRGVMHSFGGTPADVDRVRSRADLYFGINGIATFKNGRLDDTIREITAWRLLLETDSPYLAPVPHRGKRNESAYLIHTAAKCAAVLETALQDIADVTTGNARMLFGQS